MLVAKAMNISSKGSIIRSLVTNSQNQLLSPIINSDLSQVFSRKNSLHSTLSFLIYIKFYVIFFSEMKEMNTRQAKISVETMKEVQNDKALKTKGEKDRRLREKKQNNTKKFMDERKFALVNFNLFFSI